MDKKLEDEAVELFDQGKLLKEISVVIGRSEARISVALRKRGRSAWYRRYPDTQGIDRDQLTADYQNGMSIAEILSRHGVSQGTFYRHLRKNKVPHRSRKGQHQGNGPYRSERYPVLTKQVAAICLGYVVPHRWIIHHMDENPANNNPENLAIFHTKSEHTKYHQQLLHHQREGLPMDTSQLVLESGGFLLPLPTHQIVLPHERDRLFPPEYQQMPKSDQEESEQE